MKQIVQDFRTGELSVEEVPPPALRAGGLLIATEASLVSTGTERAVVDLGRKSLLEKVIARPDLARQVIEKARRDGVAAAIDTVSQKLNRTIPLGYSTAGLVIEVAPDVIGYRRGQRVACAGAGYANHAEINFVPKNLVTPVPDILTPHAACYVGVGAVAMHAVRNAEPQLGELVAVLGLGLIGQLVVQLLIANGCRVIGVDVIDERLRRAQEAGAEAVTPPGDGQLEAAVARASGGIGADAVIIAAASSDSVPVQTAGRIARDRARVVIIGATGMKIPRELYYAKELSVRVSRSYGPGRYDRVYEEHGVDYPAGYVRWTETRNMAAFLELAAAGRIHPEQLTTHRFPLSRATEAYSLVLSKANDRDLPLGIVLESQASSVEPARRVELAGHVIARAGRNPLGISVVGAGEFGAGVLIPQLSKLRNVALRGLCSASGLRAQAAGKRHGFAFCTSDLNTLLDDPETSAVLIATRHDLHAEYTARVLETDRLVLVEKPLALSLDQLAAVARAMLARPGRTLVGFNRRFAPLAQGLREHFAGHGPLLLHYRVNAGPVDAASWINDPVQGGGSILGEACHFLDLMTFLTGARPKTVAASALSSDTRAPQADVQATIDFDDGSVGHLLYCRCGDRSFSKERIELFGGGRAGVLDDFRRLTLVANGRSRRWRRFRQDKGHGGELAAFALAARDGKPQPIDDWTLLATCLATLAIPRAVTERRPVSLDELWPLIVPGTTVGPASHAA